MINEKEDIDVEPTSPLESENLSIKSRTAFSKLRRELTDEELKATGVQKMLLNEIERLEKESINLADYRDKYSEADKSRAILQEKFKTLVWSEVLYTVGLSIGSLLIGVSLSIKEQSTFILWLGIALSLFSIIARIVKKWI